MHLLHLIWNSSTWQNCSTQTNMRFGHGLKFAQCLQNARSLANCCRHNPSQIQSTLFRWSSSFCQESSYCVRRPYKCRSLNICRARRKSAILPEPTLIDILQSSPAGIQNAREISRNSSKVSGKAILWIKFCQNETSKRSQLGLDCKHRYCTNVAQAKSSPFLLATQSGAHSRGAFRDFRPTYSLWSFKPVCGSMWHN